MSQFKVEVIADNSGRWCGNELVFATQGDAETYAADLASRWTLVREWRVIETDESRDDRRRQDDSPSSSSSCDRGFTVTLGPITRVYRSVPRRHLLTMPGRRSRSSEARLEPSKY